MALVWCNHCDKQFNSTEEFMNHLDDSANKACFQYFIQKKQTKYGRSMPTVLSRMEKK